MHGTKITVFGLAVSVMLPAGIWSHKPTRAHVLNWMSVKAAEIVTAFNRQDPKFQVIEKDVIPAPPPGPTPEEIAKQLADALLKQEAEKKLQEEKARAEAQERAEAEYRAEQISRQQAQAKADAEAAQTREQGLRDLEEDSRSQSLVAVDSQAIKLGVQLRP